MAYSSPFLDLQSQTGQTGEFSTANRFALSCNVFRSLSCGCFVVLVTNMSVDSGRQ